MTWLDFEIYSECLKNVYIELELPIDESISELRMKPKYTIHPVLIIVNNLQSGREWHDKYFTQSAKNNKTKTYSYSDIS